MYRNAKPVEEIQVGKKEISNEEIILEPVKMTTQPKRGPNDEGVFAIEIPGSINVINVQPQEINDEPMDQKMMKKIGLNHTTPQIAVAV